MTAGSILMDKAKLDEIMREPALQDLGPPEIPSEPEQKWFKSVSKEQMDRLFEARQAPATKNTIWGMKIFQGRSRFSRF